MKYLLESLIQLLYPKNILNSTVDSKPCPNFRLQNCSYLGDKYNREFDNS